MSEGSRIDAVVFEDDRGPRIDPRILGFASNFDREASMILRVNSGA